MILYNWKTVLRHSRCSSNRLLAIMFYIAHRPHPKSRYDINLQFVSTNWRGSSFLLNPKQLLMNRWLYKDSELVFYIWLASLRNYQEYKVLGIKSLPLSLVADREQKIQNNSLLQIRHDNIYFKFE